MNKQTLLVPFVLSILTSCSMESPWGGPSGEGAVNLDFRTSGDVRMAASLTRATSVSIDVPPSEKFSVTLRKSDGSYSKTWPSLADFRKEASFRTGSYTISVQHGDENSEGYASPWFHGDTPLTISEGETTSVALTASLKNAIVEVEYTEAFRKYFSNWQTTLHSSGHTYLTMPKGNDDFIYIVPGYVDVSVKVTDSQGRSVTLNPSGFNVTAGHYHKVRYNVNGGNVGDARLEIVTFGDDTELNPVTVDLSDELFSLPAPELNLIGFENDETVETLEGNVSENPLKFEAIVPAQIASAILTVDSHDYNPVWGKEIDLCKASVSEQVQIEAAGIKAMGFFRNPDKLAMLDISGFCTSLEPGTHTISFKITDKLGRESEVKSLTINTHGMELDATAPVAADFGEGNVKVRVEYNGTNPGSVFSFEADDNAGVYKEATVISWEEVNPTRSFEKKYYDFTLHVPETERTFVNIKVKHNGKVMQQLKVLIAVPEFSVEVDSYAKYALLKVTTENAKHIPALTDLLHIYVGDASAPTTAVKRDRAEGIITLTGLASSHAYTLYVTPYDSKDDAKTITFSTEAEAQVPNGDFESLDLKIDRTIQQGGQWTNTAGGTKRTTTLTMKVSEPQNWNTSNGLTCDFGSSNLNSWYVVPSVYNTTLTWLSNQPDAKILNIGQSAHSTTAAIYQSNAAQSGVNAMVVRSVGYNKGGGSISYTSQTGNSDYSNYYGHTEPTDLINSPGVLKLGSDGNGVMFTTRPNTLKGFYKYHPNDSDEKGTVYVELLSNGTVIASGNAKLSVQDEYTLFEVPLTYNIKFNQKATALKIEIKSTDKASAPTTKYCNKDECVARGAMLTIDNLTFEY